MKKAIILLLLSAICCFANTPEVGITWTAPGDDGYVGQAFVYDIRYALDDSSKLITAWDSCYQVIDPPNPAPAGTEETCSFIVENLPSDTYIYVAVKTADEAGNWSEISNIARFYVGDLYPPGIINDVQITIQFTLTYPPKQ